MPKYTVELTTTVYVVASVEADSAIEAKRLVRDIAPQDCGSSLDMDFEHGSVESCDTRDHGWIVHDVISRTTRHSYQPRR